MTLVLLSFISITYFVMIYLDQNKSIIKRLIYFMMFISLFFILNNYFNDEKSQNLILLNGNKSIDNNKLITENNAKIIDLEKETIELNDLLQYKSISLIGEGLTKQNQILYRTLNFQFFPNTLTGFLDINYSPNIYVKESTNLKIKLNVLSKGILKIKAFGKTLDSVVVGELNSIVTLNITANVAGNYIFDLEFNSYSSSETYFEKLALEIKEAPQYRILILMAKQNAEWKFLTRYLEDQGHFIISRINYGNENDKWLSTSKNYQFSKFNEQLINATDIILLDIDAYQKLNPDEKLIINKTAHDKSSLIILHSEKQSFKIDNKNLEIDLIKTNKNDTLNYLANFKSNSAFEFTNNHHLAKTLDKNIYILAPIESYSLYLSGQKNRYAQYWASIFKSILINQQDIIETEKILRIYQANKIAVRSIDGTLELNKNPLKLEKDLLETDLFYYSFISDSSAWYNFNTKKENKAVYIYPENSWQTLNRYKKIEETKKIASKELKIAEQSFLESLFNQIFFICLFFLSLLILWFYEKFF